MLSYPFTNETITKQEIIQSNNKSHTAIFTAYQIKIQSLSIEKKRPGVLNTLDDMINFCKAKKNDLSESQKNEFIELIKDNINKMLEEYGKSFTKEDKTNLKEKKENLQQMLTELQPKTAPDEEKN